MTVDFVMSLLFVPLYFTSFHSYSPRGEISLVIRFIYIHEITLGNDDEKKGGRMARDCAMVEKNDPSEK